jgi:hypothetical protein
MQTLFDFEPAKPSEPVDPHDPDLLDKYDCFNRKSDHLKRGHGVWALSSGLSRERGNEHEVRYMSVIYDNEWCRFKKDKTGLHWNVSIDTHYYVMEEETTGWGSSQRKKRKCNYRYRDTTKQFGTREEAVAFAQKLLDIFERLEDQE